MPKQTFWNLPPPKREALVTIALAEFAAHDYTSASISRIVAQADIAKGSLYQYFDDKRDLFLFLVDHAQQTLLAAVQPPTGDSPKGFFATLRAQMSATVRAALAHPLHARLLQRAYTSALPFRDDVLSQAQMLRQTYFRHMVEQGIAQDELSPTLDPATAALVISAVIAEVGPFLTQRLGQAAGEAATVHPAHFDDPTVEAVFDQVIEILQSGLGKAAE